ncbi:hypothetical protein J7382_08495 [Shimia sp. R11_0]|uniref:hypothetical protein n=1 Tax=Shimia sp. R11_0 TaxID=2821096 RepID=UPI001ADBF4D4|nr:hypothetical protein [Shimia sp. R11_0]MBO9477568.1 hypothetical protein [Shimia sp. R11_0]
MADKEFEKLKGDNFQMLGRVGGAETGQARKAPSTKLRAMRIAELFVEDLDEPKESKASPNLRLVVSR